LALVLLIPASTAFLIAQTAQHSNQADLVSNQASLALTRDANLVNPWGLTRSSKSPRWVSDHGTGRSTLYDGAGAAQSLVVTIPPADTSSTTGTRLERSSTEIPMHFKSPPAKAPPSYL
jgi:hypothetical protein